MEHPAGTRKAQQAREGVAGGHKGDDDDGEDAIAEAQLRVLFKGRGKDEVSGKKKEKRKNELAAALGKRHEARKSRTLPRSSKMLLMRPASSTTTLGQYLSFGDKTPKGPTALTATESLSAFRSSKLV